MLAVRQLLVRCERPSFTGADGRLLRQGPERGGVDSHREDAEPHFPVGELDSVDLDREPELGERRSEMPEVGRCVETNQVGAQQSAEQAVTLGQGAEKLLGRERDVEEEPDPGVRQPLP